MIHKLFDEIYIDIHQRLACNSKIKSLKSNNNNEKKNRNQFCFKINFISKYDTKVYIVQLFFFIFLNDIHIVKMT